MPAVRRPTETHNQGSRGCAPLALTLIVGLTFTTTVAAAPPLDRLLPVDTTEYALAPDLAKLEAGFNLTQFGRLWKDPRQQPFRADATTEMIGWLEVQGRLGMNWADLLSVTAGETACASFPISDYRIGRVALIDSTGRADAVTARLAAAADKARPQWRQRDHTDDRRPGRHRLSHARPEGQPHDHRRLPQG